MTQHKPIPSQQLPQCQICKQDPVPQSTQHILLLIIEVGLIFVNWKLSIIMLMIGYSFPQTLWKCPRCARQIVVQKNINPSNSIFLKIGKCMALFSINKFRIFASAIIIWMIYLLVIQPKYNPKLHVTKTWQSMIDACGFEVYMENSVRSNRIYNWYLDSGYDWEIQAVYLSRQATGIDQFQNIYFKMNPTQFKDPDAYDFKAFTKNAVGMQFNRGDVIKMKGQWQGRQYHNFIFNPILITKTGQVRDPASSFYLYDRSSLLRSHLDAVKSDYQYENNNKKPQSKQPQVKIEQVKPVQIQKTPQQIDDHIRQEESKKKQTI